MAKKPKAKGKALQPTPAEPVNPNQLRMKMIEGKTEPEMMAIIAVEGVASNAMLTNIFSDGMGMGRNDLTACVETVRNMAKNVERGDLGDCEKILVAQAITLNTVFTELARRAALNMGTHPEAMDRYLRLAFKAQAQSRCTVEALAEMKNPRQVTFAKQVNNANGPQQVNNGTAPGQQAETQPPRTEETGSAPTQLLEIHDAEWVDAGAQGAPAAANPDLATMAAIHRPPNRGRKAGIRNAGVQGRRATANA